MCNGAMVERARRKEIIDTRARKRSIPEHGGVHDKGIFGQAWTDRMEQEIDI